MTGEQGQTYTVSNVSGTWSVDANGQPFTGPEGLSPALDSQIGSRCKYDLRFPYGRLIGYIGNEDNGVFSVGQGFTGTASRSGELYLGMNDGVDCFGDNAGSVTMAVGV